MPRFLRMTFSSDLATNDGAVKARLRFGLFFSRMWLLNALPRLIFLPDPVSLKRFAEPLWVLIFGIARLLLGSRGPVVTPSRRPVPPRLHRPLRASPA